MYAHGSIGVSNHQTTIAEGYNQHWTSETAVDELVQNWIDEVEKKAQSVSTYHDWKSHLRLKRDDRFNIFSAVYMFDAPTRLGGAPRQEVLGSLYFDSGRKILQLINLGATIPKEAFLLGVSGGDKKKGNTRGKFGDGLPSSTCVLTRGGFDLFLETGGRMLNRFRFEQHADFNKTVLTFSSTNLENFFRDPYRHPSLPHESGRLLCQTVGVKMCGVEFNVNGRRDVVVRLQMPSTGVGGFCRERSVPDSFFQQDRYLFLKQNDEAFIAHRVKAEAWGEVFWSDDLKGRVYVKDMLCQERAEEKTAGAPHFGYNLTNFSHVSRDRQNTIPHSELQRHVMFIWDRVCKDSESSSSRSDRDREAVSQLFSVLKESDASLEAGLFSAPNPQAIPLPSTLNALAREFQQRHPLQTSFPIRKGDERAREIVEERLKLSAVEVRESLLRCLLASRQILVTQPGDGTSSGWRGLNRHLERRGLWRDGCSECLQTASERLLRQSCVTGRQDLTLSFAARAPWRR
uniref:Uncharacterized protein n=1 Tax=Chromera velia CCMP2878 TaxID=1169474 RepID=A0A0G4I9M6_9ALVE|eukprot:Cvel_12295.t1-p1 / transcript=Cvel_12295.t1 / gene=Cvel_12295 / organism=Chromera_velia_CCMP2878 / gene_product=hypothetical protein / transcript_product=hypothetical protein / location=Cvel_scaffold798:37564-39555(+) / protein_length=515 / sequence_SO=supercontig / SO=protein_coding / is_pseudo=false